MRPAAAAVFPQKSRMVDLTSLQCEGLSSAPRGDKPLDRTDAFGRQFFKCELLRAFKTRPSQPRKSVGVLRHLLERFSHTGSVSEVHNHRLAVGHFAHDRD